METNYQNKLEETLISALKSGFVVFFYQKLNGERRAAVGTSNIALVKQISCWRPKGGTNNNHGSAVAYYDLIEEDWRSFRRGNLIDIAIDDFSCPTNSIYRYITDTQTALRMAIKYAAEKSDTNRMESLVDIMMCGRTIEICDAIMADIKLDSDNIKKGLKDRRTRDDISHDIDTAAKHLMSLLKEYNKILDDYRLSKLFP